MDKQPARSGGRSLLQIVIALAALVGLGIAAWVNGGASRPDAELKTPAPVAPESPAEAPPSAPATPTNQATAAVASQPGPAVSPYFLEAQALRAESKLQAAREKAIQALDETTDENARREIESFLGQVGMALLLSPLPMPEKTDYTVQPGDSLDKIARRFGTTVDLIKKSNSLRGAVIRPGDRLRVFSGKWSIRVSKSRNDLVLSLNDQFFKRYRVGSGEYAKTPTGEFKITDRIAQPTWWHPDGRTIPYGDPENLLGTHWLALDIKGFGLHGTWEPDTIGRQSSMGCVRLLNEDIEELFTLVTVGTPVVIEE